MLGFAIAQPNLRHTCLCITASAKRGNDGEYDLILNVREAMDSASCFPDVIVLKV